LVLSRFGDHVLDARLAAIHRLPHNALMPENSFCSSGSMFVLMDQPAQTVVSTYPNPMISDLPMPGVRSVLDRE
jgi:hypothetical protein